MSTWGRRHEIAEHQFFICKGWIVLRHKFFDYFNCYLFKIIDMKKIIFFSFTSLILSFILGCDTPPISGEDPLLPDLVEDDWRLGLSQASSLSVAQINNSVTSSSSSEPIKDEVTSITQPLLIISSNNRKKDKGKERIKDNEEYKVERNYGLINSHREMPRLGMEEEVYEEITEGTKERIYKYGNSFLQEQERQSSIVEENKGLLGTLQVLPPEMLETIILDIGFNKSNPLIMANRTFYEIVKSVFHRQLRYALRAGDIDKFKELIINTMVYLNAKNEDGYTPLHLAALSGKLEFVQFLIKKGADVNTRGGNIKPFFTPFHLAHIIGHTEIANFLFEQQAFKNKAVTRLHFAAMDGEDIELIKMHIKEAIAKLNPKDLPEEKEFIRQYINVKDANGYTPLHRSARGPHLEVIKYLVEQGADVNARDNNGYTPLHWAVGTYDIKTVQFLLAHNADIDAININGNTPLHVVFINNKQTEGLAGLLIENGASVNLTNKEGYTPLDLATQNGQEKLIIDLIINRTNNNGHTSIHLAILKNNSELVSYLLKLNANPNTKDRYGNTPLHMAVRQRNLNIIKILLDNGAELNATDDNGWSPLAIAIQENYSDVVDYLRDRGADEDDSPLASFF